MPGTGDELQLRYSSGPAVFCKELSRYSVSLCDSCMFPAYILILARSNLSESLELCELKSKSSAYFLNAFILGFPPLSSDFSLTCLGVTFFFLGHSRPSLSVKDFCWSEICSCSTSSSGSSSSSSEASARMSLMNLLYS